MNTAVIVCVYTEERWDLIAQVLRSLRSQTLQASEVLVVVDHNDALYERLASHLLDTAMTETKLVRNGLSPGLSGARNTGLAMTQADVVAFIDDDAEADVNWLSRLTEGFDDRLVVGVGGAILPVWPSERPVWFPQEFDWVVGCTYRGMPTARSEVRNPIGANMAFRREPLASIGGFDATVGRIGASGQGCEETTAAIRLRDLNPEYRVVYEPTALVYHHVETRRTSWRYFRQRCYAEGRSKAQVARLTSSERALATERSYVRRVLPQAVGASLYGAAKHRNPVAAGTAAAVIAGLTFTCIGYLTAMHGPSRLAAQSAHH